MSYQQGFFTVPYRIFKLVGDNFAYLKVYEIIFQFWNKGNDCWVSNEHFMERTGIKSESTLRDAFLFFEKHGELKRKKVGTRRYFIQPERKIEYVDAQDTVDTATEHRRYSDAHTVDTATHNNNNINNINNNKNYCASDNAQDDEFEQFWIIYPKKKDKKRAKSVFSKIPKRTIPDIMRKLAAQISQDAQWQNTQYIPYPAKYLQDERWNDEIVKKSDKKRINEKNDEPRCTVPWFNPDHARVN